MLTFVSGCTLLQPAKVTTSPFLKVVAPVATITTAPVWFAPLTV